jgi:hypothetical protein
MGSIVNPDNDHLIAIMGVDPGTTTGVALAILERPRRVAGVVTPRSVWKALSVADVESYDVAGIPSRQAWDIMEQYHEWREPYRYNVLVFEDFVLMAGHGSDTRSLLDPVRVTWGCEALSYTRAGLRWATIEYRMPSAKQFATNDRLRRHGLWVRGSSEHRRDAARHVCTYYAGLRAAHV